MIAQQDLKRRLLYILPLGLVEIRTLALAGRHEQVADLADALEILPRFVEECCHEDQELVRFVLKTYQDKYPGTLDLLVHLDQCQVPERF